MARREPTILRRRALLLEQSQGRPLFLLGLTGDELFSIAELSRVSRDDDGRLIGYQRPEVRRHVQDIVSYLNSDDVLFPNSIILALSSSVQFRRSRGPQVDRVIKAGILEIPLPRDSEPKPGWIVDGQQRALALSRSKRRGLPVPVSAFVTDDVQIQRDQFLRVNNTKPLPRGLLTELLPEVQAPLPRHLAGKQVPSLLCDMLNRDPASPFRGLIRRHSTSRSRDSRAVVADSSIISVLRESLTNPSGCLFTYCNIATGETDFDGIQAVLFTFWSAVQKTFPDAWGRPPAESRLMHGAGMYAMGRLMDRIMPFVDVSRPRVVRYVRRELEHVAPHCRWTGGRWPELGNLAWNEIQNVPGHLRLLSDFLVRTYLDAKSLAS